MASDEQTNSSDSNNSSDDTNEPAMPATDELGVEINRLTQELGDFKDKYVRAYAEMDNMRRRHDRDRADLIKYALENVFKDFLPALDSLEKALPDDDEKAPKSNGSGTDHSYYEGMKIVKRQLLDVFKKHGLESIRSEGTAFDPNLHQAIQRVESKDVKTETVGNEYARGYLLNGRLLRPAMVSVLTPHGS